MYADAVADVGREHYGLAEKRLVAFQGLLPPEEHSVAPATLLLSLVYIRLGRFHDSAEMALKAIRQARSISSLVKQVDIDYMLYVGKVIYERAVFLADAPRIIDVGVTQEELRIDRVRLELTEQFPINELTTYGQPPGSEELTPAITRH